MRQTSVIRVTGDICFFFSVLSIFKAFQVWRLPMALFADRSARLAAADSGCCMDLLCCCDGDGQLCHAAR